MKRFLITVLLLIQSVASPVCFAQEYYEQSPFVPTLSLFPVVGVMLGTENNSNKIANQFFGARVSPVEYSLGGKNKLSFAVPGVSIHTDAIVSFSVSPIMIVVPNKIALGVDYFFSSQNIKKESFGVFVGFELL